MNLDCQIQFQEDRYKNELSKPITYMNGSDH